MDVIDIIRTFEPKRKVHSSKGKCRSFKTFDCEPYARKLYHFAVKLLSFIEKVKNFSRLMIDVLGFPPHTCQQTSHVSLDQFDLLFCLLLLFFLHSRIGEISNKNIFPPNIAFYVKSLLKAGLENFPLSFNIHRRSNTKMSRKLVKV